MGRVTARDTLNRMGIMERITTWNRKHVLLADALYAVIIPIFFTLMAGTNDSNPGIIAYFDHTVMAFWSFVLMVPVAMRRWKPQMATLLFAGLVVVQLAFGPSMVYADLMAPWMLYSAIVYADPRNSKAFIVLAVAIGALASPVIIWSADAGPILNQGVPFDGLSPLETCSGTYIYGLSGDCATTITTSSVAIFIFIAVYLFAAIIVAYWQRARRITVSMMHERNDALQAKEDEERHIAALAERARIAREIHDNVGHQLTRASLQAEALRVVHADEPGVAADFADVKRTVDEALQLVRTSVHALNDNAVDLSVQLERIVEGTRSDGGPQIELEVMAEHAPANVANCFAAVLREALSNTMRHACAQTVTVRCMEHPSFYQLIVTDDGVGEVQASGRGTAEGMGLAAMRRRLEGLVLGAGGRRVFATVPKQQGDEGR